MERKIAGLFDLDGVILDTEDFYSQFWGEQGRYIVRKSLTLLRR